MIFRNREAAAENLADRLKDFELKNPLILAIPRGAVPMGCVIARELGAVTTRYLAQLIESIGIDHVVTLDVHNPSAFENAFRIPTSNLSAGGLFANELKDMATDFTAEEPLTVVSPDVGGIKRCEAFRDALVRDGKKNVELAYVIKKRRDTVLAEEIVLGHLQGRSAIILDDMISTGATIVHAANACWERGASEILVAATHGLFVGDAARVLSELRLEHIWITNSVVSPATQTVPLFALVRVIDSSQLVAAEIRRIEM